MIQDKFLALQVLASMYVDRIRKSEAGQASAEYAGIIFVAVILVMVLIGAASGWGDTLVTKISDKLDSISG